MSSEVRSLFGAEKPGPSKLPSGEESFSKRAERLCGKFLSGTITQSCDRRRKRRANVSGSVLIDYQGQRENDILPKWTLLG